MISIILSIFLSYENALIRIHLKKSFDKNILLEIKDITLNYIIILNNLKCLYLSFKAPSSIVPCLSIKEGFMNYNLDSMETDKYSKDIDIINSLNNLNLDSIILASLCSEFVINSVSTFSYDYCEHKFKGIVGCSITNINDSLSNLHINGFIRINCKLNEQYMFKLCLKGFHEFIKTQFTAEDEIWYSVSKFIVNSELLHSKMPIDVRNLREDNKIIHSVVANLSNIDYNETIN